MPLLPGEAGSSGEAEDAEHWVAVYEELMGFLLRASLTDPTMLERFQARLAYWRQCKDELTR